MIAQPKFQPTSSSLQRQSTLAPQKNHWQEKWRSSWGLFCRILKRMCGRMTGVVSIMAALGCSSTVDRVPPSQTDGQAVMIIGGPSSGRTIGSNEEIEGSDSSRTESTPASVVVPERCQVPGKRDPPAGALAWISECKIKTVKPIYFQFNSDVIHIESEFILQAVANVLLGDLTLRVEIAAHSDGRGSHQHNLELTQKRADAVKNYLIGRGVDTERLIARGFGEERPISHPPLVDGQRTNRRIEFVILPK